MLVMDVQTPPQLKEHQGGRVSNDRVPSQELPRDEGESYIISLPSTEPILPAMQSSPQIPVTSIVQQEPRSKQSPRIVCTESACHEGMCLQVSAYISNA